MSKDGGRTLQGAGGVHVCETAPAADGPSPAGLRRDKMGTPGTEHKAEGAKPLQGPAGCQLILPGPKDCINFHITHGFKKSPAFAQALVLIPHPPSSRGEPSLFCAHCGCSPDKGSCRAAPVPDSLVLHPAAGSVLPLHLPGEHRGLR